MLSDNVPHEAIAPGRTWLAPEQKDGFGSGFDDAVEPGGREHHADTIVLPRHSPDSKTKKAPAGCEAEGALATNWTRLNLKARRWKWFELVALLGSFAQRLHFRLP
jgi:hypothetical protein